MISINLMSAAFRNDCGTHFYVGIVKSYLSEVVAIIRWRYIVVINRDLRLRDLRLIAKT